MSVEPTTAPGAALPWWRRVPWLTIAVLVVLVVYNIQWYRSHPQTGTHSGPQQAMIGKPAPLFSLRTLDGAGVTGVAETTGKVRLIDFWSTGCGPCKRELPSLAVLARDLESRPFALLSVNIDSDVADREAAIRRALGGAAGAFPVLLDDGAVAERYAVYRIPFKVLVDADGVVRQVFTGGSDADALRDAVEQLLPPKS